MRRLGWVLLLVLAGALVAGVLLYDPRSREEQVREACRDLLDACLARDFEEIWDLFSAEAREEMAKEFDKLRTQSEALEKKGLQLEISLPEAVAVTDLDDEELFVLNARAWLADCGASELVCSLWLLPPDFLQDLRVTQVTFSQRFENPIRPIEEEEEKDVATVTLELLQPKRGVNSFDPVRLSFVRRWGGWGLHACEISWSESLPPSPPPPTVAELLDQVRAVSDEVTLDLECGVDLPWPDASRIFTECAQRGLHVVQLQTTDSPRSPCVLRSNVGVGVLTHVCNMRFKTLPGALRVAFPPEEEFDPAEIDAIVEVAISNDVSPGRERLRAWLDWLLDQKPDAIVLLAPRPEVTCGRAAAIAQVIHDSGVETLLVAAPGTAGDAAPSGELLLNGHPLPEFPEIPDPSRREPNEILPLVPILRPCFPPVPPDHPALRRVIR